MNIERIILGALQIVHPRMLSESVLLNDVRLEVGGKLSLTDLRGHLQRLEAKDQVVVVNGEDVTRVKITSAGIARLAE